MAEHPDMTAAEVAERATAFAYKKQFKCPLCGARNWGFSGLVAPTAFKPWEPDIIDRFGKVVPMATLTCIDCLYVAHFSWMGILRGSVE